MRRGEVKRGSNKNKYSVSVYSTTQGEEECFLGKRMSTNLNYRSKQNTKILKVIEEKRLSKR
jgi:hypothetical protein